MYSLLELCQILTKEIQNNDSYNECKNFFDKYKFKQSHFAFEDSLKQLIFVLLYSGVIKGYNENMLGYIDDQNNYTVDLNNVVITNVMNTIGDCIISTQDILRLDSFNLWCSCYSPCRTHYTMIIT